MNAPTTTGTGAAPEDVLRALREAQETLRAIRTGEVDALVVHTADGDQLFTLGGADRPYRLFVEAMAEAGLVVSASGIILSGNPRLAQLTGVALEDLIGSQLSKVVSDDSRDLLQSLLDVDPEAPSSPVQLTVLARDRNVPVMATAGVLDLGDDTDTVLCLLLTDISERMQAEETQRFHAQLLDAAGEAIIVTDAEGVAIYVNRAAEHLYGWTAQEFLGRPVTETTPSDASVQQALEIMDRLRAGDTWSGEFMLRRKDGTEFPAFVHDTPVFDDAGGLRAIIGISTDITERKRAEAQLVARERWFRTLVSSASDFIAVLDAEGMITFANEATTVLVGFDPAAGASHCAFDFVHPDDLDNALSRFELVKSAPAAREQVIMRVKNAGDTWRYVDANMTNCLDDPAIAGIVANARDITDSRRLERAFTAVSRINEIIVHATDETKLLDDVCAALVELGDYTLSWVGRADPDSNAVVRALAAAGARHILDETIISAADTELGQGITGTAIRTRTVQIVSSFAEARFGPWRDTIANHDIGSGLSYPLEVDDEIWALSIYAAEEDAFDAATVEVFDQLAADLVFGVVRLRDGERLAQSELNLREAERLAHLGHWAWDIATGRFELLAAEAYEILGITHAEWGQTYEAFLELVHPEDRSAADDAFAIAKVEGSCEVRHRIVRSDGEVRYVVQRAEAFRGEDTSPVRIAGTTMDITDLVMADVAKEEARQYVTAITDNMAEGMFALDAGGTVNFVNDAGCRLLGWDHDDLLGRPGHETFHSHRADGSPYPIDECPLAHVRALAQPLRVEHDTFTRRDGTLLPVDYSASPLTGDHARGVVVVFNDISDRLAEQTRIQQELDKLAWVGRVRDALDQDRFVLYAQPIVDLGTGQAVSYELLIRMIGLDGTIIPPAQFIPAAEEYGLIAEIDRWVVMESARLAGLGVPVEFNLSAKSVMDPHIVSFIADALRSAGARPDHVVCEITETALMADTAVGEAFVVALNEIGCKVALDDFGVGYSGFSYLKRLPVTTLKIDREFIADAAHEESSRNVVAAVVSLARAFSAKTVAEGAEDMETVETLRDLGVDYVQGYVFGRPVPLEQAFRPGSFPLTVER